MALRCNIDSRGRVARLVYGVLVLLAGVAALGLWALPSGTVVAWVVSAALLVTGALAIFESRKGWCVMRALGFKTPI